MPRSSGTHRASPDCDTMLTSSRRKRKREIGHEDPANEPTNHKRLHRRHEDNQEIESSIGPTEIVSPDTSAAVSIMSRATQPSRTTGSRVASGSRAQSPYKQSPVKIPLNDDAEEKARRMHSRQARHERQISQIRAAATPQRRRSTFRPDHRSNETPSSGPGTGPSAVQARRGRKSGIYENDEVVVAGSNLTPLKRVPILANFEEWMRLATDNKINAANSWNFALIDYFHDMSLLKEGDSVNFQKASCTLDGCVKIYTSRVDSVANETGKLLSGLADSGSKKSDRQDGGAQGEGDDSEEEVDEDGNVRKKTKKKQRSAEATLAPSFASLQLKKFELEFAVDPLFKKASADFDEGGAKGLLLNHLMIDSEGRIVFDSSDDTRDVQRGRRSKVGGGTAEDRTESEAEADVDADPDEPAEVDGDDDGDAAEPEDVEIDLAALGARFFPDLSVLDELDVCPSLKTFELGGAGVSLDIPFTKSPEDWQQDQDDGDELGINKLANKSGVFFDEDNPMGFDEDDGFELGGDVGFGEGGEAWAREAALNPQARVYDIARDGVGTEGGDDPELVGDVEGDYTIQMGRHAAGKQPDRMHDDILGYFDQALKKNWASAEHWKIRKIKDVGKLTTTTRPRKEKTPFQIDFLAPLDAATVELIFTPAATNATISLAKKDRRSPTKNLLPDDKHFNSKQLLSLFLKPRARMGRRKVPGRPGFGGRGPGVDGAVCNMRPEEMDEEFWARQQAMGGVHDGNADVPAANGEYDADFFDDGLPMPGGIDQDDDDDGDNDNNDIYADAVESFPPDGVTAVAAAGDGVPPGTAFTTGGFPDGAFGTTLVTASRRARPDYLQYARVAKKVDVRRLKENMWSRMGFQETIVDNDSSCIPVATVEDDPHRTVRFSNIMDDLHNVYPKPIMDDISTSYCFICVLHLANEKGLVIENTPDLDDLEIRKDLSAEIAPGDG